MIDLSTIKSELFKTKGIINISCVNNLRWITTYWLLNIFERMNSMILKFIKYADVMVERVKIRSFHKLVSLVMYVLEKDGF